jgi:RNA polymerase sigma-70 factor (ECF subfamily)
MTASRWADASETDLLAAVLSRAPHAWDAFHARYERLMISCIRKVLHRYTALHTDADVEDMLSSTCVNLIKDDFHKLKAFDVSRGYKLSSWVGLIATNTAHDALRGRDPLHDSLEARAEDSARFAPVDDQPTPDVELEERERWQTLQKAMDQLSPDDRTFLVMCYAEELEPEEIARKLGIALNTVYSRKNKIREKLRRVVEGFGGPGEDSARSRVGHT